MDIVTLLILGLATATNLGVIKMKLENNRNADAILDATVLVVLGWVFSGTITGLAVATIASAFISAYLWLSPPNKLIEMYSEDDEEDEHNHEKII